nr:MAG TPA: hypothetical protein [Caudoviricetes sp.]
MNEHFFGIRDGIAGFLVSCSAVAISGAAPAAGCSARTAGTTCRTPGGTTAVAHRVSP